MAIELATEDIGKPITDEVAVVSIRDRFSSYPSKGLTPEKLSSLLRDADAGDVYRQMELAEEILEKDGLAQALNSSIRLAVSRLPYSIIPASEDPEAMRQRDEIDKMIKRIKGWKNSIADIADCYFKGFSISEILWQPPSPLYDIGGLRWLNQKRFRFGKASDPYSDAEELRITLDPREVEQFRDFVPELDLSKATIDGISLETDPRLRSKFIVTYFRARSGSPARASLIRPMCYLFLFKNFDVKWWVQFAEIQLGYRIGKYDPSQPDQKKLLEDAISGLATDAAAVISKDSEIEFKEMLQKASSHQVYKELKEWCSEEMMQLWLGHTGAAQSTPGKLGAENAAENVFQQRIEALAETIDESVTDQIVVPFIKYNFGEQDEYPYYKTDSSRAEDLSYSADVLVKLQSMGYPISKKYVKEKFGVPLADPEDTEDEILQPRQISPQFFPGKQSADDALEGKKKLLTPR